MNLCILLLGPDESGQYEDKKAIAVLRKYGIGYTKMEPNTEYWQDGQTSHAYLLEEEKENSVALAAQELYRLLDTEYIGFT